MVVDVENAVAVMISADVAKVADEATEEETTIGVNYRATIAVN